MKRPLLHVFIIATATAMMLTFPACKKNESSTAQEPAAQVSDEPQANPDTMEPEPVDIGLKPDTAQPTPDTGIENAAAHENDKERNPSFYQIPNDAAFESGLELTIQGKKVRALTVPAQIDETREMECVNDACDTTIRFSDKSIAPAYVQMSLNLYMENLGDLDGDGNDEIGCYPEWWTSVWHNYHFLTYKNGEWTSFVPGVTINIEHYAEHPYKTIEKDPSKSGWYITKTAEINDDGDIVLIENKVQTKH